MKEPYGEGLASHPDPKPCVRNPLRGRTKRRQGHS